MHRGPGLANDPEAAIEVTDAALAESVITIKGR